MMLFLVISVGYVLVCTVALVFFLVGRSPALIERDWPWPVIFLWPLMVLLPLSGPLGKWKATRRRRAISPAIPGIYVPKHVPEVGVDVVHLASPFNSNS